MYVDTQDVFQLSAPQKSFVLHVSIATTSNYLCARKVYERLAHNLLLCHLLEQSDERDDWVSCIRKAIEARRKLLKVRESVFKVGNS